MIEHLTKFEDLGVAYYGDGQAEKRILTRTGQSGSNLTVPEGSN